MPATASAARPATSGSPATTPRFQSRLLFLAKPLVGHHVGLDETDDGVWAIHFNATLLATFDERDYVIHE